MQILLLNKYVGVILVQQFNSLEIREKTRIVGG